MADPQERCIDYYQRAWYSPRRPLANRFGKQFPNQKLTPEQRLEVYQLYCGGVEYKDLAERFQVSVSRIRSIVFELKSRVKWE